MGGSKKGQESMMMADRDRERDRCHTEKVKARVHFLTSERVEQNQPSLTLD